MNIGPHSIEIGALVPPVARPLDCIRDAAASCADRDRDVARVRPHRCVLRFDAEVMSKDPILRLLIAGRPARDELIREPIDTCAAAVILGDASRERDQGELREPLGTLPDFPADFIANTG